MVCLLTPKYEHITPIGHDFHYALDFPRSQNAPQISIQLGRSGFIVFHRLIYKHFCAIEAVNIHEQVYFVALQIL